MAWYVSTRAAVFSHTLDCKHNLPQLPKEILIASLPLVVAHILAQSVVVHRFVCGCLLAHSIVASDGRKAGNSLARFRHSPNGSRAAGLINHVHSSQLRGKCIRQAPGDKDTPRRQEFSVQVCTDPRSQTIAQSLVIVVCFSTKGWKKSIPSSLDVNGSLVPLLCCRITEADMQPFLNQALANLITALNYPQSRENHYIMKGN